MLHTSSIYCSSKHLFSARGRIRSQEHEELVAELSEMQLVVEARRR